MKRIFNFNFTSQKQIKTIFFLTNTFIYQRRKIRIRKNPRSYFSTTRLCCNTLRQNTLQNDQYYVYDTPLTADFEGMWFRIISLNTLPVAETVGGAEAVAAAPAQGAADLGAEGVGAPAQGSRALGEGARGSALSPHVHQQRRGRRQLGVVQRVH